MSYNTPFYLTLPSDASMEVYPQNTSAEWTTKLPQSITLTGRWEVGLVEFHYVNSLYTIRQEESFDVYMVHTIHQLRENVYFPHEQHFKITVPPGIYRNAQLLLDTINKQVPTIDEKVGFYPLFPEKNQSKEFIDKSFSYRAKLFSIQFNNQMEQKAMIKLGSARVRIVFPPNSLLQAMLGFAKSKFSKDNEDDVNKLAKIIYDNRAVAGVMDANKPFDGLDFISEKPVNPMIGNQQLYVYCDVADYGIVGDTSAQVLRAVPIRGEVNALVENRFDFPHYVPVLRNYFDTIQVVIANDVGDNAKFNSGKSLVKLHFRPLRPY